MTILSIITASFLVTASYANETKEAKAEADKSSKVEMKVSSVGEEKSVGEIIKIATDGDKKESSSSTPFDYKLKPKKVADNVWCFFGA